MKYDVFISYKSQSINVVKAIAHILEDENIRCWYAPRDLDNQSAGKDYDDKIVEAITNCNILVVVLSNAALSSEWVKAEVSLAQKQKKLVIPYVVSELQVENGLRMRLESKHWIDAYPNPERKFSLLLKNIKIFLNSVPAEEGDSSQEKRFTFDDSEDYTIDFDYDEGLALLDAKEYNDAALAFMASAERGNKNAKDQLCQMFYDLEGCEDQIQDEIWDNIERQAKDGHCYANFLLHCKIYKDASNNLVSFEYLKKAIKSNSIGLAFLRMGIQYNWGMGVKQSHTLGMHYYNKALALNCKEAYSYIGQELKHGSDKTAKDETKALEILTKGIELGDNRSYTQLTYYYLYDKHDKEKAIDTAQKAIKCGYNKGYSLLGDVYMGDGSAIEQDQDEAIKWYKEALKHDEKSAYGSLAILYYNQYEYDDAYDMARRGRYAHDSQSIYMLGFIYEKDEKYDEAWQCYREQYDRFGIGADNLANLIMYKSYRPDNITDEAYKQLLDEIEQMLEILARNYSQQCLEALIKFYSFRADGVPSLDYDIVKKVPKAADFIRLGAEMGIPEMMFYIGNTIFIDKDNEKVNPYKGIEWLEKAAYAGHEEACKCIISIYHHGKYQDHNELDKIIEHEIRLALEENNSAIDTLLDSDIFPKIENKKDIECVIKLSITKKHYNKNIISTLLDHADCSSNDSIEAFINFLTQVIDDQTIDLPNIFKAADRLINLSAELSISIPNETTKTIQELMWNQVKSNNLGGLHNIFGDKSFSIISSSYKEDEIFSHYEDSSVIDRKLFYAKHYANEYEINIKSQDDILERLHSLISFDDSLLQDSSNYDKDVNELIQAMVNYQTSYLDFCNKEGLQAKEYHLPKAEHKFPYMPSSVCAKISYDTFCLFLTLQQTVPDIYKPMLPLLRDDSAMLDYIETIEDQYLQLFIISFVEIKIDIETIMLNNYRLYNNCKDNKKEPIIEYLNNFIEKYGDKVTSKETTYTLDNLPDLSEITPNRILNSDNIYEIGEKDGDMVPHNASKQQELEDEFERLLNEFINSSSKEEESQK